MHSNVCQARIIVRFPGVKRGIHATLSHAERRRPLTAAGSTHVSKLGASL